MATTVAELTAQLTMNNANFKRGLKGAQKSMTGFQKQVGQLKSMLLAAFTITAAVRTFKKAIASTQQTSDKFAASMGAAKEATQALFASVVTGDFEGLIRNMRNAAEAGRDFANAMDEIADRTRSVRIQSALAEKKVYQLREIATDTSRIDKERVEAYQEILNILSSQVKLEKQIAEDTLQEILDKQIQRNDLTKEQGNLIKDYVVNYEQLSHHELKRIQRVETLNKQIKKLESSEWGGKVDIDADKKIAAASEELQELMQSLSPLEVELLSVSTAINKMGDEERDAVADVIIQLANMERKLASLKNEAVRGIGSIKSAADNAKTDKSGLYGVALDAYMGNSREAMQRYSEAANFFLNKSKELLTQRDLWGGDWMLQGEEELSFDASDAIVEGFDDAANAAENLGQSVGVMLVNQFDSLGNAIGRALSGAESGLEDLGQAILSNLGNILIMAGLQTLPAGLPLVIAGVALQIGTGIWQAVSQTAAQTPAASSNYQHNVTFEISGRNLQGVLGRQEKYDGFA